MSPDRLAYMANQIGKFFAHRPHEAAVAGVEEHLRKFWDPRMRNQIVEARKQGTVSLDPAVGEAVERLAPPQLCPPNRMPPVPASLACASERPPSGRPHRTRVPPGGADFCVAAARLTSHPAVDPVPVELAGVTGAGSCGLLPPCGGKR